jgi:hypothetical protein
MSVHVLILPNPIVGDDKSQRDRVSSRAKNLRKSESPLRPSQKKITEDYEKYSAKVSAAIRTSCVIATEIRQGRLLELVPDLKISAIISSGK